MSKSLRHWIKDYVLNAAKIHGIIEDIPVESNRLVQIFKFITYGQEDVGGGFIWAQVTDGESHILVRFSKETAGECLRKHERRLTSFKTVVGVMRNFKPCMARTPQVNQAGLTARSQLYLQAGGFDPRGSYGEAMFGHPRCVSHDKEIQEWITGLRLGGGGGHILRSRYTAQQNERIITLPTTASGSPQIDTKSVVKEEEDESWRSPYDVSPIHLLEKVALSIAKGTIGDRVISASNKCPPSSYLALHRMEVSSDSIRTRERPRKRRRISPTPDPLDLDVGSSPNSQYSVITPEHDEDEYTPSSPATELVSNWDSTPPHPTRLTHRTKMKPTILPSPIKEEESTPVSSPAGSRATASPDTSPAGPRVSQSERDFRRKQDRPVTSNSWHGTSLRSKAILPRFRRKVSPPRKVIDPRGPEAVELVPNSDTSYSMTQSQSQPQSQSQSQSQERRMNACEVTGKDETENQEMVKDSSQGDKVQQRISGNLLGSVYQTKEARPEKHTKKLKQNLNGSNCGSPVPKEDCDKLRQMTPSIRAESEGSQMERDGGPSCMDAAIREHAGQRSIDVDIREQDVQSVLDDEGAPRNRRGLKLEKAGPGTDGYRIGQKRKGVDLEGESGKKQRDGDGGHMGLRFTGWTVEELVECLRKVK